MARRASGRRLLTVLFTDIVGSTRLAAELGDRAWRQRVARHHALVRQLLKRHHGREMDTAGDGFFAVFRTPADAVSCALEIANDIRSLGLEIRAGVHMGEVEDFGGKAGGMTVNIGARIAALADSGQVLVSSTVREVVTGSQIRFAAFGRHSLKGVDGEWRIYEATQVVEPSTEPATGTARPGRLTVTAMTTACLTVIATGAVTAATESGSAAPLRATANTAGHIDLGSGRLDAVVPVGARPYGALVAAGSVWTANQTADTVSRIDPSLDVVVQTIQVGAGPTALAYADNAVWVTNSEEGTVSRIDPATNVVTQTVEVGNGPVALLAVGTSLWVVDSNDASVRRVDARTGGVDRPIGVGSDPSAAAFGAGALWVTNSGSGTVSRVDPASGSVTAPIPVGNAPSAVTFSAGAVWVANDADGTVSRIDPSSNTVRSVVKVGDGPSALLAARGSIWVASRYAGTVSAIDPGRAAVVRTLPVGTAPIGLAADARGLWVTTLGTESSAHRGGTLRLSAETRNPSLDLAAPQGSTLTFYNAVLTTDGLVSYRRTGGLAGTSIVADLATSVPVPTDGGRAYTFQLRPDVRYSTGQAVRPEDVRASVERQFRLEPDEVGSTGMLQHVIGVPACLHSPGHCDLSRGITTDLTTNSVTFHLDQPDPEFLQELANSNWAVFPAGLSPDAVVAGALPATGPYKVGRITKSEVVFIRNPMFHVFSPAARPDGYPDEIVIRLMPYRPAKEIGEVRAGDLDLTTVGGNDVGADQLQQLRARFPAQIHDFATGQEGYMWLNTAAGPFSSRAARQAVNFAVDRRHVADLVFPDTSRSLPSCQVLPPNVAGYAPYCPYTEGGPATGWTKPDLVRARRLVAASGTRGERVTVLKMSDTPSAPVSDYLVALLNRLGYRAHTRSLPLTQAVPLTYQAASASGRNRIDMGPWLLGAPYPSAAFYFLDALYCSPKGGPSQDNFAHFCDKHLDSAIDRARSLQVTDPTTAIAAWKQVDRMATDAAPWLFAATVGQFDFVSKRVGNYQNQPASEALLDQLWVR